MPHINRLVQERHNSSALALYLCLSCINPSRYASFNKDIIGSNNGLSPDRHQAIIWTIAELFLLDPWEQISVKFHQKRKTVICNKEF